MYILPVLDLVDGAVVRATAGRRKEYRPVVSALTASSRPPDVARAFRERFGLNDLYLADLDAITGAEPAFALYAALREDGFRLTVDAGVHQCDRARRLAAAVDHVVVGLETVAGPGVLREASVEFGDRITFSLDLKSGMPLGDATAWGTSDPVAIAEKAVAQGVRRLIVLELTRVGGGEGVGSEGLCRRLTDTHPTLELIAGGGVRGADDLRRLRECGVRGALVASALHDGRLTRADWEGL